MSRPLNSTDSNLPLVTIRSYSQSNRPRASTWGGIELNVDRGKALPPGIRSKFGTVTPEVDTVAEKALPPGQELNVDRGKLAAPGTVTPDNETERMERASDGMQPQQ